MASQILRRLIVLGAPGSGKATIASRITKTYGMPYIATGDLIRQNIQQKSEDSRTIKEHTDKGLLVPDDIIIRLLMDEIEKNREHGFILDGYPRTLTQAEMLYRQTKVDRVIALRVPPDEIFNRLKDRQIHLASGRVYHATWCPPKSPDKDDETGEPLSKREDDKAQVLIHRLKAYEKNAYPILQFYQTIGILQEFHGRDSDQIWAEIKTYLDRALQKPTAQRATA